MRRALTQNIAIAVGVEAGNLQNYKSGIYGSNKQDCGEQPNHAVVVIGYGGSGNDKYWIVQNSWSSQWGENGYYKHKREGTDGPGACGIQTHCTYPIYPK
jgi:C1A family cysteine protease